MASLTKRLPRLSALLMFEAAARHLSFTLAAREIRVTQAAVSQQVRALERELGVTLFTRLHRGLALTREGRQLHRSVSMAFDYVAATTDSLRGQPASASITIGVTFAMATFWLVPRLPSFRALHPDIEVHVIATDRGIGTAPGQVDVAIAFGSGEWPGFKATLLREGEAFAVCSPAYLERRGAPLRRIEQLLDEMLLVLDDDRPHLLDWPLWFAELGVSGYLPRRTLKLNSQSLLLQAAREGQGIALSWNILTDVMIEKNELVRPLDATLRTRNSFYFITGETSATPEVERLRAWLFEFF